MRSVRVGLAFVALATSACGVRGLNFLTDTRVDIVEPGDRAEVTVPVTLRWTVKDFEVTGKDGARRSDAGYFAVLVDRAPPPPGKPVEWLVRDDEICKRDPACPNGAYLESVDIFVTTETEVTLTRVRDLDPDSDRRDRHEAVIVLLNGRGERIGESVFKREFEVDRG